MHCSYISTYAAAALMVLGLTDSQEESLSSILQRLMFFVWASRLVLCTQPVSELYAWTHWMQRV